MPDWTRHLLFALAMAVLVVGGTVAASQLLLPLAEGRATLREALIVCSILAKARHNNKKHRDADGPARAGIPQQQHEHAHGLLRLPLHERAAPLCVPSARNAISNFTKLRSRRRR